MTSPEEIDWRAITPLEFLEHLAGDPVGALSVRADAPKDWITAADVRQLLPFVNSTQPAAAVIRSECSQIPGGSTVGREAQFLIRGAEVLRYPPQLSSARFMTKEDWRAFLRQTPAKGSEAPQATTR